MRKILSIKPSILKWIIIFVSSIVIYCRPLATETTNKERQPERDKPLIVFLNYMVKADSLKGEYDIRLIANTSIIINLLRNLG